MPKTLLTMLPITLALLFAGFTPATTTAAPAAQRPGPSTSVPTGLGLTKTPDLVTAPRPGRSVPVLTPISPERTAALAEIRSARTKKAAERAFDRYVAAAGLRGPSPRPMNAAQSRRSVERLLADRTRISPHNERLYRGLFAASDRKSLLRAAVALQRVETRTRWEREFVSSMREAATASYLTHQGYAPSHSASSEDAPSDGGPLGESPSGGEPSGGDTPGDTSGGEPGDTSGGGTCDQSPGSHIEDHWNTVREWAESGSTIGSNIGGSVGAAIGTVGGAILGFLIAEDGHEEDGNFLPQGCPPGMLC